MLDPLHRLLIRKIERRSLLAGAAIALAGIAAGCSASVGNNAATNASISPEPTAQTAGKGASGPVKVAMLLPLAGFGQSATLAKSMKQAGEMALFERDNPNVQLLVKDDAGTPEGARAAADQAIRDGAELIIGPLYAKSVSAIAQQARQSNVPVLAFSNDSRVAGNGVYLVSFLIQPEVDRIVSFAVSKGKQRFAALIPADAYGDTVEPVFRAAVSRHGGTLVHLERYAVGANAMLEPSRRVAEAIRNAQASGAPVDALFLPGGQDTLPQLAPLLAYQGIEPRRVQLIGTGAWDYPNVGREQMLAGGWYPSPDPRGWQDFSARFSRTFGSAPPRLASLAHDAVSIAVALSAGAPGQRYSSAALTNTQGFSGVDGTLVLGADGHSQRRLAILEIQQYGNNVIDEAPQFAVSNSEPGVPYSPSPRSDIVTPPVTGSVYVPAPAPASY
ncbi:MAG: penicillin-binding protein activator [Hyphomicrobiaceae bacterium]|nr:penicillin-binding protein activator [Hyphomicrobiaceae bacterium]